MKERLSGGVHSCEGRALKLLYQFTELKILNYRVYLCFKCIFEVMISINEMVLNMKD